ncbi:hypothetical protein F4802DRAFT_166788 [Xylaria palmicola]|nr:hypothetical protein F4802DRAFT_166788 [Xylaria palmicola]
MHFWESTYKYTVSLLPHDRTRKLEDAQTVISLFRAGKSSMNRVEKAWRKVSWALFREGDVRKLERDLLGHLSALQLYEISLQHLSLCRVEKCATETALLTRNIEGTAMRILDSLKPVLAILNGIPPQILDKLNKCQPIFFEDALGRLIELPREFCVSKERFKKHLEILFEGLPGHHKVVRGEYHIENPAGTTIISTNNWHLQVTAGTRIAMTLLFQLASKARSSSSQICPKCNTTNHKPIERQGITECFNCKLMFEIVDTENPACWRGLEPPQQGQQKSIGQDAFRRIRYFCENETSLPLPLQPLSINAPASKGITRGGFYKYRCKSFYQTTCCNWVYVNGTACSACSSHGVA